MTPLWEWIRRLIAGGGRSPAEKIAEGLLVFLSFGYLALWWTWRTLYRTGILRRRRLPCPVVSVGNLTTGGTGKTPVVIALAERFCAEGRRVAVLSRGYGRRTPSSRVVWVSDGERLLAGPEEGGDEPVMIARKVPRAAVVVCADRHKAGREVLERFRPDLVILDDGFQRRYRLHRDLDILTFDGLSPFSTGRVLPAGLLREPLSALQEANVFILNKADQARSIRDIETVLQQENPRAFRLQARYTPRRLRELSSGREVDPRHLEGVAVGALSAVASPLSFVRTLARLHVIVRHAYTLPDHADFRPDRLRSVLEDARARRLEALVVTEKDEVKLPREMPAGPPVLVLEVEWEVTSGKSHWEALVRNLLLASSRE